jgi:hypothetical protein
MKEIAGERKHRNIEYTNIEYTSWKFCGNTHYGNFVEGYIPLHSTKHDNIQSFERFKPSKRRQDLY